MALVKLTHRQEKLFNHGQIREWVGGWMDERMRSKYTDIVLQMDVVSEDR